MQIRIYDHEHSPLTTLVITSSNSDFNGLTYRDVLMGIGDASFVMRLDNAKCTQANIRHYNIIEICEDDATPRWVGVIVDKKIALNTVTVSCYSLLHVLARRLTGAGEAYNDTADDIVSDLLSNTNADEDTHISDGIIDDTTTTEITFNRSSVLEALNKLAKTTGAQFRLNADRTLDFSQTIGADLSATVIFQYQLALIASANILSFNVQDGGQNITSKSYGVSDALTSSQEDSALRTDYGLLEFYEDFREINDQTSLDQATANSNNDSEFSPEISLSPSVSDVFEVGDLVRVKLENRLVSIDGAYQITEKTVLVKGSSQKQITVRTNSNVSDFFKQIRDMKSKIDLLNRSV